MEKDVEKTLVVFRCWREDGAVIALFPEIKEVNYCCMSYMHLGQHSAADYNMVIGATYPATAKDYTPLKRELEGRGYNLAIRKRFNHKRTA